MSNGTMQNVGNTTIEITTNNTMGVKSSEKDTVNDMMEISTLCQMVQYVLFIAGSSFIAICGAIMTLILTRGDKREIMTKLDKLDNIENALIDRDAEGKATSKLDGIKEILERIEAKL